MLSRSSSSVVLVFLTSCSSLMTMASTPAEIWPLDSVSGSTCATTPEVAGRVYSFESPWSFTSPNLAQCTRQYQVSASAAVKLECQHFLLPSTPHCGSSSSFLSVRESHNNVINRFCHEELNNFRKTHVFPSTGFDHVLTIDIEINQDPVYYWTQCSLRAYVDVECGRTRSLDSRSLDSRSSLRPSSHKPQSRIVNGHVAVAHQLPWQAGLISNKLVLCGGVVLANQWVLTAAHCVIEVPNDLQVVLGEHDLNNDYDSASYHRVSAIFRHPEYKKDSLNQEFDFALLLLEDYVFFSSVVVPICLPRSSVGDLTGQVARVSGWGQTEQGDLANTLRLADVTVYNNNDCLNRYFGFNPNTMVCARGVHTLADACTGDSGGPLTRLDAWGGHQLLGIVSSGELCGHYDYPGGVYGRVDVVIEWIRSTTNNARLFYSDN